MNKYSEEKKKKSVGNTRSDKNFLAVTKASFYLASYVFIITL